jgi:hypothetical protein
LENITIEKEVQQKKLVKEQVEEINKKIGEVVSFATTSDNCHQISDTKYSPNESSEDEEKEIILRKMKMKEKRQNHLKLS